MTNSLLIFLGGGLGCLSRYLISTAVSHLYTGNYPVATFVSNVVSSVILLFIVSWILNGSHADRLVRPLVIIGYCGGFSTFSTFSFETAQLIRNGNPWVAVLNVTLSVSVCVWIFYRYGKS